MKKVLTTVALCASICIGTYINADAETVGYPFEPVPFTSVKITDSFWGERLRVSRDTTIPLAFRKCEESGRYENFVKAANPSENYKVGGFPFDDTDVYKTIEGASYLLQTYPDKKLESYIDSVLVLVAAAQEPDGYLNTSYTMNPAHPHPWMSPTKWEKVENLSHEFYNLGHLAEAAVAHYQATGKRNFLDIAIPYADCVCNAIGSGEGQLDKVPGHQIAEMGLAKLYLVTGNKKYLDQAKYFLDRRGDTSRRDKYSQAHLPVVEQDEAVGHAVRAVYMYSGMADVAALTGDSAYIKAIDRIWDNIVSKKLYVTGGIGARHDGESFGDNYELPNADAYCETCAAIGNVYLNHRLFLLHGDSKYYDALERTLYNGLISGVSLEGNAFFYPNPLASNGSYSRKAWFDCSCCPSNICRFIPSLPGYIYAVKDKDIYVNLYMANNADINVGDKTVKISQNGDYVWNGKSEIEISDNKAGVFTLKLRIPGWATDRPVPSDLYTYTDNKHGNVVVSVNGENIPVRNLTKGYLPITRKWKKGDRVEIKFDNFARIIRSNDKIKTNIGKIAIERGPIVYCAEWPDNDFNITSMILYPNPALSEKRESKLHGIVQLNMDAQTVDRNDAGDLVVKKVNLSLIPYYAWAHRGEGYMKVWLPTTPQSLNNE